MSSMVATSHMLLVTFKFKLNEIKIWFCSCTSHLQLEVAMLNSTNEHFQYSHMSY